MWKQVRQRGDAEQVFTLYKTDDLNSFEEPPSGAEDSARAALRTRV